MSEQASSQAPVQGIPAAPQGEAIKPPQPTEDKQTQERWAQFARKEKALRQQTLEFQKQQKAWQEQQSKFLSAQDWKQKFLEDPATVGLTYEEMAQRYLNQPSAEDQKISQLKAEIAALKGKYEETDKKIENTQKQAYDQALKQISREVSLLVDGNDEFEAIKANNAQQSVTELIKLTYEEEGYLLSAEDAAKQVEDHLVEQALTLSKLKKIQEKLAPKEPETKQQTTTQRQVTPTVSTLTNSMVPSSTKGSSNAERRARAIAAFEGRLNK
jgi:hypothetical protein